MIGIGVIGYGYWGPNIVRNVSMLQNSELVAVCDKSASALERAKRLYPRVQATTDYGFTLATQVAAP